MPDQTADFTNISVDEAQGICLEHACLMSSEHLALTAALGRVLACDIYSRREHPPWDNSAMDGYAVRFTDIRNTTAESPTTLKVIGEARAGDPPDRKIGSNEALRIMTGAPIPAGSDTVVRQEDTESHGDTVAILQPPKQGANIRKRGEDVALEQKVITAGTLCRPAEIGMMATAGAVWGQFYQRPRVSILATGNELAEPGENLPPEKIINSNAYSIAAQVSESGGLAVLTETARDSKHNLQRQIEQAITADIALIIGGVSVGKYDFVKEVLHDTGCEMKFWRVRMRPGHPVAFGVIPSSSGQKLLFGLPGNPVACMVAFYQFVLPVMRKMMGMRPEQLLLTEVDAILDEDISIRSGRRHFARAVTVYRQGCYHVRLSGAQGSGILTSMVQANCFMVLPEERGRYRAGEKVRIQLFPKSTHI